MVPPASIFGLLPTWVGVYLVSLAALALAGYLFYRRVLRYIRMGKHADRFDHPGRRLKNALVIALGQRKVLQSLSPKDIAGAAHALIFYGFLSFLISYVIFIAGDSLSRNLSRTLLTEAGVRIFADYLDVMAVVLLVVLVWGVIRRWVVRPHRLSFDLTRAPDAIIIVLLIVALMVLSLLTEAFYVASGGGGVHAEAFIGRALGQWFQGLGMNAGVASALQATAWWLHLGVILAFAIYIPLSKHMHMFAAPVNAYFTSLEPRGALMPIADLETAETFGAGKPQDLTWKQLLDGYACAVCGRCTSSCPANLTGKELSPMHIVENIKHYLLEEGDRLLPRYKVFLENVKGYQVSEKDALLQSPEPSRPFIGGAVTEEAIWQCVTCGACEQECPVAVEHIDTIIDVRRHLVMSESRMPDSAQQALVNLETRGHPWRGTRFTRTDWAKGLDVKVLSQGNKADLLYWVGCTSALEERSQKVARSFASLLQKAGVDFAILGDEERCSGDPARRMGNEYLFQMLAQQNIETLNRYGVKRIVTNCPHCYNTLRNEYPKFGGNYEVMHHSELLAQLVAQERLQPQQAEEMHVAYHDPCYLARHNDVADPPRQVIQFIPGLKLEEVQRRRKQTFCCGAGGGHMWMEEQAGKKINHARTEQLMETGAPIIGTACPFCLQMFEDAIRTKGIVDKQQARDVAELLAERVEDRR